MRELPSICYPPTTDSIASIPLSCWWCCLSSSSTCPIEWRFILKKGNVCCSSVQSGAAYFFTTRFMQWLSHPCRVLMFPRRYRSVHRAFELPAAVMLVWNVLKPLKLVVWFWWKRRASHVNRACDESHVSRTAVSSLHIIKRMEVHLLGLPGSVNPRIWFFASTLNLLAMLLFDLDVTRYRLFVS